MAAEILDQQQNKPKQTQKTYLACFLIFANEVAGDETR